MKGSNGGGGLPGHFRREPQGGDPEAEPLSPWSPRTWNDILNGLSREDTAFGQFLAGFLGQVHDGARLPPLAESSPLFPMPVPYPAVETPMKLELPASPRRRARLLLRRAASRWTNRLVGLFNFIDCEVANDGSWRGRRPSGLQAHLAAQLLEEILHWCRLPLPEEKGGCGRSAALITVLRRLSSYGYSGALNVDRLCRVALPVKTKRVAVPDDAGLVDPLSFLPPDKAAVFSDWKQRELEHGHLRPPIKPCYRVARSEEGPLFSRLAAVGMGKLYQVSEVRAARALARGRAIDWDEPLLEGGVFAVRHKETKDRLIYDRRPRNDRENRLAWSSLPLGAQWAQLVIPPSCCLRGSADDLSTYFYCLKQAPLGWAFNVVGPEKSLAAWRALGVPTPAGQDGDTCVFCLSVQGMGDLNAVDIAQEVHEELLRKHGALLPRHQVRYDRTVPDSDLWQGLYVDDLVTTWICPRRMKHVTAGTPDGTAVAAASGAYASVPGLRRAEEKAVRFVTQFKLLGVEIDGEAGTLGAPALRRCQVALAVALILRRGTCDRKSLEQLLGSVVFVLQVRREFACILQETFRAVDAMAYGKDYRLDAVVKDELWMIALIMPLCVARLRWPLSTELVATDATPCAHGATSAEIPARVAACLYRVAEHRGEYVRLDWNGSGLLSNDPAIGSRMSRPSKELDALTEALPWQIVTSRSFAKCEHVNVQELGAIAYEVKRWVLRPGTFGTRRLVLTDSRVALGAWAKGRSSSRRLNMILRSVLGALVLGRLRVSCIWISTGVNPADHPSRFRPLPQRSPLSGISLFDDLGAEAILQQNPAQVPPCAAGPSVSSYETRPSERPALDADASPRCVVQLARGPAPNDRFFLELWAGSGGLTRAVRKAGFRVLEPFEAYPKGGRYRASMDLRRAEVREEIEDMIRAGLLAGVHFGIPCRTFSQLPRLFGHGTRTRDRPLGDGSLERENAANDDSLWMCRVARLARAHNTWWTIENPQASYLWHLPNALALSDSVPTYKVTLDQCVYGLGGKFGAAREY